MTNPVAPPAAPTVPVYPALGSPSFNQEAYTFGSSMPAVSAAIGDIADAAYTNAQSAFESASSASNAEVTATAAAAASAAAAGATKWASGTYAQGAVVWSPANGLLYRRKTAGGSSTDPSADSAGWWLIGAPLAAPILEVSANTTAQSGVHYVLTAAVTLTLPASPAVRDVVQITDLSGSYQAIVNPNGQLIRGQSGNLTLNMRAARVALVYSGASKGWI